jgi:hypothetical protein
LIYEPLELWLCLSQVNTTALLWQAILNANAPSAADVANIQFKTPGPRCADAIKPLLGLAFITVKWICWAGVLAIRPNSPRT